MKDKKITIERPNSYQHGLSKTPFHNKWNSLKQRCLNEKNVSYKDYGGRGITVSDGWMKFENFLEDMGIPKKGLTYEDQIAFYISKVGDEKTAIKWVDYAPVLMKIHQAVCRAKRKPEDNPVIILWGIPFGVKQMAYSYMPEDLQGIMCNDNYELLNNISLIKKRKSDNGNYI